MIIDSIHITNYKSFRNSTKTKIDEHITIILAKNEQGKTNLLKALEKFPRDMNYSTDELCTYSYVDESKAKDILITSIIFTLQQSDKQKLKDLLKMDINIDKVSIQKYCSNRYIVGISEPNVKVKTILNPIKSNREEMINNLINEVLSLEDVLKLIPDYDDIFERYKNVKNEFITNINNDSDDEDIEAELDRYKGGLEDISSGFLYLENDFEIHTDKLTAISEQAPKIELTPFLEMIVDLVPPIVYFSNVDLIKDSININEYISNKEEYKTFTNLFMLSGLDVEELIEKTSIQRRRATKKASATVTGLINDSWTQEEVRIYFGIDGDNLSIFIEDDTGAMNHPSERSDGFQWYLSFYSHFMIGTKGELADSIILLDNPGSLLHASGQKDLFKTLEIISENNQIIFTTHSPFLIDKNRLELIRTLEKKKNRVGSKITEKFYKSQYDALEPIRAAIGARVSDSLFGSKINVLVEGFSDKIYLESFSKYLSKRNKKSLDLSKILINCAGGADKIPWLCGFIKAEKYDSLIILDNDNKGREVVKDLKGRNMEICEDDIFMLDKINESFKGRDIEIEDLINYVFYHSMVNKSYSDIFKDKIGRNKIDIDELTENSQNVKRYEQFFKDNKLGSFDKVRIAKAVRDFTRKNQCKDTDIGVDTVQNFKNLFSVINQKFDL